LADCVKTEQHIIYVYTVNKDVDINKLILQESEVEEVAWMTISEIEKLMQSGQFFENVAGWRNVKSYLQKINKIV